MTRSPTLILEEQPPLAEDERSAAWPAASRTSTACDRVIGYTEIVLTSLDPTDDRRADAGEIGRAACARRIDAADAGFSRRQVLQLK
jgi:hypothetical protein